MLDLLAGGWVALLPSALNGPVGVVGDLDAGIAVAGRKRVLEQARFQRKLIPSAQVDGDLSGGDPTKKKPGRKGLTLSSRFRSAFAILTG